MEYIAMETNFITGLRKTSGDPSPFTAYGVYNGIKASCLEKFGSDSLKGLKIAVQGVGHVGYYLIKHLIAEGALVTITDIKQENIDRVVSEMDVKVVNPNEIYSVDCDVFAPCALGAVINDETIPQFKCKVIAGAANNLLKEERHAQIIQDKGILYAPDYVINGGGVINVYQEIIGYDKDEALNKTKKIYDRLTEVYKIAREQNITTALAADRMAEQRIKTMKNVRSNYIKR